MTLFHTISLLYAMYALAPLQCTEQLAMPLTLYARTHCVGIEFGEPSDTLFKVLGASFGVVVLNEAGERRPVRTGMTLHRHQTIVLTQQSYLALLHTAGKTLELRAEGTYTAQSLEEKILQASATPSSAKLAAFVMRSVVTSSSGTPDSHRANMNSVGAVARMSGGTSAEAYIISPRSGNIPSSTITLYWRAPYIPSQKQLDSPSIIIPLSGKVPGNNAPDSEPSRFYTLEIVSESKTIRIPIQRADTVYRFNLTLAGVQPGASFSWTINTTTDTTQKTQKSIKDTIADHNNWYRLRRLSEKEYWELRDALQAIDTEFTASPQSALRHYLCGQVYERFLCYTEALAHYAKALQQTLPIEVPDYADAFHKLTLTLELTPEDAACIKP